MIATNTIATTHAGSLPQCMPLTLAGILNWHLDVARTMSRDEFCRRTLVSKTQLCRIITSGLDIRKGVYLRMLRKLPRIITDDLRRLIPADDRELAQLMGEADRNGNGVADLDDAMTTVIDADEDMSEALSVIYKALASGRELPEDQRLAMLHKAAELKQHINLLETILSNLGQRPKNQGFDAKGR